jgi:branched-chain amino acid transport system ATP-binding protein
MAPSPDGSVVPGPILDVRGLQKTFGSVIAAADITVAVGPDEVVGIIGANGAGKTTFVNMVTGYIKPGAGSIRFRDRDITALAPREVIRSGISRSFQVPQVFGTASVFDNLLIAIGIAEAGAFPFWRPIRAGRRVEAADAMLGRFGIAGYRDQKAGLLPQGVRKLMDIAMATVRRPKLLLLDEPTSGISVEEKFAIMDIVMGALKREAVTVMFVEHDMEIIGRYATRVLAFADGTVIADGPPDAVLADAKVRRMITGQALPHPVPA